MADILCYDLGAAKCVKGVRGLQSCIESLNCEVLKFT